ncbi:aldose 1-epimerase Mro [Clostridium aceticum]|uniref:Aldose 1-epimerase n=1 Tax=Clostridium aceticum TaxID=84022 RepID=A0A0D8I7V9_9CLOT|nr:aldose epimerase family protein [Clostridium aceticum]AKL97312.1 aldose 1-epimerase Mro [Clostridium aceticum]KJF26328.1 hypothetical protein TZ02_14270 [Clostridium aceticum]
MDIFQTQIGVYKDQDVMAYTMVNDHGMTVEVLNLGGIITKILTPDQQGRYENVVLAYENIEDFYINPVYFGAIIGRTAGRIANGFVEIEGVSYKLYINNNKNTLHGGKEGFHLKMWEVKTMIDETSVGLKLTYHSSHLEENYPGNLEVEAVYTLNNQNELAIEYKAKTDQKTLVNLTNHTYFNLSGNGKRDILGQELRINADKFLELDEELIPTGRIISVEGTPFDFRSAKPIGKDIEERCQQLLFGAGYDHPWILNSDNEGALSFYDPVSTRAMDIETNQKAVIFYSMNEANEKVLADAAKGIKRNAACFETQGLPIGPNQMFAEEVILSPEETYYQKTIFRFYNK